MTSALLNHVHKTWVLLVGAHSNYLPGCHVLLAVMQGGAGQQHQELCEEGVRCIRRYVLWALRHALSQCCCMLL